MYRPLDSPTFFAGLRRAAIAGVLAAGVVAGVATGSSGSNVRIVAGPTSPAVGTVSAIALDTAGNMVFASDSQGRVARIANGSAVPIRNGLAPGGVAISDDGTVFYGRPNDAEVIAVAPGGGESQAVGSLATSDLAWDQPSGTLYGLGAAGAIKQRAGGVVSSVPLPANSLNQPRGFAVDGTALVVADTGNNRIVKVQPSSGEVTPIAGSGAAGSADGTASQATFDAPADVAALGDGRYVVADRGNHTLRLIDVDGKVSTLAGSAGAQGPAVDGASPSAARFSAPSSVAVSNGEVFVADRDNQVIRALAVPAAGTPTDTQTTPDNPTQPAAGPGRPTSVSDRAASSSARANEDGVESGSRPAATDLPAPAGPQVARRALVEPAGGEVSVKVPGSARFVSLDGRASIPMGSVVDTTEGRIRLTAASNRKGGRQTAIFSQGVFKLRQTKGSRPVTELVLRGAVSCPVASKSRATTSKRRKVRKLWGRGHGRFRTRGRRSAATVTGTIWGVYDRCDGTLTKVRRGSVSVRDFGRAKSVTVTRGQQYLAKATRRDKR